MKNRNSSPFAVYHCSYFTFAELRKHGIDVVARAAEHRLTAFGKRDSFTRLKNGNLLVTWHKPKRLGWMSIEEYQALPKTLTVRLTEVCVREKGSRCRPNVMILGVTAKKTRKRFKQNVKKY